MGDEEEAVVEYPQVNKAFFEAIYKLPVSEVEALIAKNGTGMLTIASEVRGWSPVSVATGSGELAVDKVKALLAAGATVSAVDKMGMTALHMAADKNDSQIMVELLAAPDFKAALDLPDEDGCTPLHYAAHAGRTEIVAALLAAGANPSLTNKDEKTAAAEAQEQGHAELSATLAAAPVPQAAPPAGEAPAEGGEDE